MIHGDKVMVMLKESFMVMVMMMAMVVVMAMLNVIVMTMAMAKVMVMVMLWMRGAAAASPDLVSNPSRNAADIKIHPPLP